MPGTKSEDGIDDDPDAASASTETAEGESKLGEELAASSCLYEASEVSSGQCWAVLGLLVVVCCIA